MDSAKSRFQLVLLLSIVACWIASSIWTFQFATTHIGIYAMFREILITGPGVFNDTSIAAHGVFSIHEYDCNSVFPRPYFAIEPWFPHAFRQMSWAIGIPYWILALAVVARWGWVARRLRKRIAKGECPHCGYDLRSATGTVCSECGRTIVQPKPNELFDGNSYGQM